MWGLLACQSAHISRSEEIARIQACSMASEGRVVSDEADENGLIMKHKYLPKELLSEILFHVDPKTLLNCQLVCKRWYALLRDYVWRKKAEAIMERPLIYDDQQSWLVYYAICANKVLEKNLIKNHSGRDGTKKHWHITRNGGNAWKVERPPIGVPPLPISEPVFEGREHCFVTSYSECSSIQTVDLVTKGLLPQLLDQFQPPIMVSEWYSCRYDCEAMYECLVKLVDESGNVLDQFKFQDILENEKQNLWLSFQHEFTNYGPGLRKVIFKHSGKDRRYWAGHYGSKMAGACVKVCLPKQQPKKNENDTSDAFLYLD